MTLGVVRLYPMRTSLSQSAMLNCSETGVEEGEWVVVRESLGEQPPGSESYRIDGDRVTNPDSELNGASAHL